MVYAPQRRHAVASLASTTQTLALLQHLLTPNILILVARLLVQGQIAAAPFVHPTRSLLALFLLLFSMNLSAVLLHLLDFWVGVNGGKGLVLDFVGQATLTRILLLDTLMFILQTTALLVSYTTNHGKNLPKSPALSYDDILLPPFPSEITYEIDDEEVDLESGGPRRRLGKGKARARARLGRYDGTEEIWLDDDEGEAGLGDDASSSTRLLDDSSHAKPRRQEPPLIFDLSLPHIVNLIFRLPAPNPPRVFSGGTPAVSPTPTPRTRTTALPVPLSATSSQPLTATTATTATTTTTDTTDTTAGRTTTSDSTEVGTEDAEWDSEESDEENPRTSGRNGRRAMGVMPDIGRIPGSYWTDRVHRGGGNG